jgi:hypothetical protein
MDPEQVPGIIHELITDAGLRGSKINRENHIGLNGIGGDTFSLD